MWSFLYFSIALVICFPVTNSRVTFNIPKKADQVATYNKLLSEESAPPENFALFVAAGIRGFFFLQYPIEAGVFNAYDVLLRNNIPPKNMILMSYDEVAQNPKNPCKGKVFNSPEWRNVYDPSTIDYKGQSVTPENVLYILKGDSASVVGGNGRVIQSKSTDRIFVFISGESLMNPPGIGFQTEDTLWASDFVKTLVWMKENKNYAEMVVYMDIDVGGYFLDQIPNDIKVYGITPTGPHFYPRGFLFGLQWHCDAEMPWLTREFSYDWVDDVKHSDLSTKTFHDHLVSMKNLTLNYEKGMDEYGDLSVGRKPLGCFFGTPENSTTTIKC